MALKIPLSFDEQILRLIEHKMEIADNDLAKRVLSEINYYRFSGYGLQFRSKEQPNDYIPGTKFEDVWNLHQRVHN